MEWSISKQISDFGNRPIISQTVPHFSRSPAYNLVNPGNAISINFKFIPLYCTAPLT